MLTKAGLIVLVVVVLQASASPPRVKRQGFNWGEVDDQDNFPDRTTARQPTPANGGTTTTTPSPRFSACMKNCPQLPQYNPICGTNRITYNNPSHLNCANSCGLSVQTAFGGACSPL